MAERDCPICKGGPLNGHVAGSAAFVKDIPLREDTMSEMGKLLERVGWEADCSSIAVLKLRLLPLLEAGQAMRKYFDTYSSSQPWAIRKDITAWDAAKVKANGG
jgi:hypothetical protein